MIFKVIKAFKDLQDSNLIYNVGDVFPREGKEVSRERLNDLSTDNNLQKQPVIEGIEDVSERPNYSDMKVSELKKIAKERALNGYSDMKKSELVELLEGGK